MREEVELSQRLSGNSSVKALNIIRIKNFYIYLMDI
jgi:hypothetical protein